MSILRPSEQAALSYKDQEDRFDKILKTGIKTASTLGGIGLSSKIGSKILPFLNEHIPTHLALQGISKLSPKLGEFLKKGIDKGLDVKEGINTIKENIDKSTNKISDKNIIKKYSPELHQAITDLIGKGASPIQAAAQSQKQFKKIIQQIEKDYDADYLDIVESIFGKGDVIQNQQLQTQQSQQAQQPQGMGQGEQALMQMLQKINQSLANPQG